MRTHARFRAILLMLLVIVFFTCASAATPQSAASKHTVKVMTYNVDEGTDFAAITAVLTNPTAALLYRAHVR